mmetsp:Transcript_9220/g.30502  ORF Transcript_9220/g.30502 Transcript_9220/m.30502 type:complete len:231 (+) Transcript_9220:339-1031(+)
MSTTAGGTTGTRTTTIPPPSPSLNSRPISPPATTFTTWPLLPTSTAAPPPSSPQTRNARSGSTQKSTLAGFTSPSTRLCRTMSTSTPRCAGIWCLKWCPQLSPSSSPHSSARFSIYSWAAASPPRTRSQSGTSRARPVPSIGTGRDETTCAAPIRPQRPTRRFYSGPPSTRRATRGTLTKSRTATGYSRPGWTWRGGKCSPYPLAFPARAIASSSTTSRATRTAMSSSWI